MHVEWAGKRKRESLPLPAGDSSFHLFLSSWAQGDLRRECEEFAAEAPALAKCPVPIDSQGVVRVPVPVLGHLLFPVTLLDLDLGKVGAQTQEARATTENQSKA